MFWKMIWSLLSTLGVPLALSTPLLLFLPARRASFRQRGWSSPQSQLLWTAWIVNLWWPPTTSVRNWFPPLLPLWTVAMSPLLIPRVLVLFLSQNWVMIAPHQGRQWYWNGSSGQGNFVISDILVWADISVQFFLTLGFFFLFLFSIILADVSCCK